MCETMQNKEMHSHLIQFTSVHYRVKRMFQMVTTL